MLKHKALEEAGESYRISIVPPDFVAYWPRHKPEKDIPVQLKLIKRREFKHLGSVTGIDEYASETRFENKADLLN